MDLYKIYQYNIWHLINSYKLKYYWINIKDYEFFNATLASYKQFFQTNPWLKKYNQNKIMLANDIIKNGTFTPFINLNLKNNKIQILMGKHRIYSLKLYSCFLKINKKFLCLELPESDITFNSKILLFDYTQIKKNILIRNFDELISFLLNTGDALTSYLWENNCEPFPPFNDPELFEEWLNGPEPSID